jgi:nucleotide-binding universal stress UspA family protein
MEVVLLIVDPASSQSSAGLLAVDLAREKNAHVVALRTIPLEFLGHRGGLVPRLDPDQAALDLAVQVDALNQCGVPATGMIRLTMSSISREIASAAAEVDADLIVMGSGSSLRNAVGLGAFRPWSVSRRAPCPVVVAQACWVGHRRVAEGWSWPRNLRQGA